MAASKSDLVKLVQDLHIPDPELRANALLQLRIFVIFTKETGQDRNELALLLCCIPGTLKILIEEIDEVVDKLPVPTESMSTSWEVMMALRLLMFAFDENRVSESAVSDKEESASDDERGGLTLEEVRRIRDTLAPELTQVSSWNARNALVLLESVAEDAMKSKCLINENLLQRLRRILETSSTVKHCEELRVCSLNIIFALIQGDEEAISYVLESGSVSGILNSIRIGGQHSKAVGASILKRMLSDAAGFTFFCDKQENFSRLCLTLKVLIEARELWPCILGDVIVCYHMLTDHEGACEMLKKSLPSELATLSNETLIDQLEDYDTGAQDDMVLMLCKIVWSCTD